MESESADALDKVAAPKFSKPSLKDQLTYEFKDKVKHGNCLICGKNDKEVFKTSIPMKDSNTTGLKSHLRRYHKKEYDKIYKISDNESKNSKSQKTLDVVDKVSNSVFFN